MIATTTKFELKSWRLYVAFFISTYAVVRQARHSGGIVHMRIRPITLRTITVWKSMENMRAFRNSGAHLEAMKQSAGFGGIYSETWETEVFPSWDEAIARLP